MRKPTTDLTDDHDNKEDDEDEEKVLKLSSDNCYLVIKVIQ